MGTKLPTVVIVGRPNVGKSTLFNRIAGRRIAVVQDTPGVTRDRLYADCAHKNRRFQLVDTGGILFGDEDPLIEQIRVQAEVALAEADVVLFMVDAGEGLNAADWDLADRLRGFERPIYVVPSKADNPDRDLQSGEFHALGIGEVFPVSGIHGRGIPALMDRVVEGFKVSKEGEARPETRLAIVGRPNVGKSSLLNAFAGEKRAIVSDIPGTTRDAIDMLVEFKGEPMRLIDTAGIRRRGKVQGSVEYYMVLRATRAVQRADCALIVVDGVEGLTDGDKRVAKAAHDFGKAAVFIVNKWDLREPPDGNLGRTSPIKKDFIAALRNDIPEIGYAPVRFTSALESKGLEGALNAVRLAVENWRFRIPTGQLNRIVQDAVFEKPLSRKGRPLKVYYCTQPEVCPPTLILFCNDPELMHFSYVRYLENAIRAAFPLEGTPVRLIPRASRNAGE